MKDVSQLTREELLELASSVQGVLYLDMDSQGEFWNPEKDWDSDTVQLIAEVCEKLGLKPGDRRRA
jgi:hypothetical protein